MNHSKIALKLFFFFTILLGVAYPLAVTGLAQALFRDPANGSRITVNGKTIGSRLIAQKFEKPGYFWPRPSAIDYQPLPSAGSNLSVASIALQKLVNERRERLIQAHGSQAGEPPQDLLFASASGMDPEISVAATRYQIRRVAEARGIEIAQVEAVVDQVAQPRQWGVFGEPTVNVLELNQRLDQVSTR